MVEKATLPRSGGFGDDHDLFVLARDAIIVRSAVTDEISSWNRGAEELYGWRTVEALGRAEKDILGIPPSIDELVRTSLQSHEAWDGDLTHTCKDGSLVLVASRQVLRPPGKGDSPASILEINRVVRDATLTVSPGDQSEKTFRLMVESVKDYAIFMLDAEGVVVSWNSGAELMKGYRAEEIQGQHFSRFYLPEDMEAGKPAEELRAAAALGRRECEGWRVRKDGSRFWASVVITALRDPAGRLVGFTKVTRDFTERRRADAQLQDQARLLGLVHDAVVATNQDRIVIAWNEGAQRLYGWRADEVLGRSTIDLLKTEFREVSREEALRVLEEGGEWRGEVVQRHKSGQRLEVEAAVIVTPHGPARMVAVNRDIGERKRAFVMEERARIARDLHDSVSQALFSITLHARGLELALQGEGHSRDGLLGRVASIRQLTQGAQAEMRALIFELRPESLAEEGLVAALRRHAVAIKAKELLAVAVSAPSEHVPFGPVIEEQLYRLAQEALNNVVKHARATTVQVRLDWYQHDEGRIELEIADDGIGFDVGVDRSGHFGLVTMSERAASLGGVLEVTSSPGNGTVIRAVLPWDGQATQA